MEFYNAINGPQWTVRTGWGYVNNCTVSWVGVTCTSTSLIFSLPSNSLSGTLPDSLSQIVTLQTLNLNLNKIQGTLPASWKTLVKLSSLNIMNNALNGTLPDAWKAMFVITTLYLANNNLTGKLPASLGGPWRSINSIDVHSNSLSGRSQRPG
ncbi:GP46-like surface antigen, putative [Bodo saltans]|uniref:GP46-like surface antigen, putative n=1 Tax=Bodo saltans TaxID=75058 RepID=A0A0S4IP92_BODSA|nr:GP46-like surface antigen, putative [Bodo saltans]|eukprot:CUF81993.1 GP46-like surface antigen, putative [Bodo saltans]